MLLQPLEDDALVVETATVADALAALREKAFQAIFIDASTPDLNAAVPDRLRAAAPLTPMVMIGPRSAVAALEPYAAGGKLSFLSTDLAPDLFQAAALRFISPRTDDRMPLRRSGLRLSCVIGGRPATFKLLDISNRGLSFTVGPGQSLDRLVVGTDVWDLRVLDSLGTVLFGPVAGVVRYARIEKAGRDPEARFGVSFEAPAPPRAPHFEVMKDRFKILAAVSKAVRGRNAFVLTPPDAEAGYEFDQVKVPEDPDKPLRLVAPSPEDVRVNDVVRLSFDDRSQSYSALTSVVAVSHEGIDLLLPTSVRVYRRRGSNRVEPVADRPYTARVRCHLVGLDTVFPVHDVSTSGLSVVADQAHDLLPPGLVLDEILLRLPGVEAPLRFKGIIRSLTPLPRSPSQADARPARCGIEITGLSQIERVVLCRSLLTDGYAHADLAEDGEFPAVRQLLQEAGYSFRLFDTKDEASLRALENGFGRLYGEGKGVGFSVVYRHQGKLLGHFSGLKLYSGLWFATQLAALRHPELSGEWISRALTLAGLEQFEHRPDIQYIRTAWEKGSSYTGRYVGWAGRAIEKHGLSEFSEVNVLTRSNALPPPHPDRALEIGRATSDDLDAIERYFWRTSTLYRIQSEDLSAEQLDLHAAGRDYEACGMFRRRHVHVARLDGRRVGFSLLERATPGVHLVEVLNSFDVFAFDDLDESVRQQARAGLVSDAITFYALEGLPYSVALSTDPDVTPFTNAGFELTIPSGMLTIHRSVLRQFIDATEVFFSRRNELAPTGSSRRKEAGAA
jgi:hypothetical protein